MWLISILAFMFIGGVIGGPAGILGGFVLWIVLAILLFSAMALMKQ